MPSWPPPRTSAPTKLPSSNSARTDTLARVVPSAIYARKPSPLRHYPLLLQDVPARARPARAQRNAGSPSFPPGRSRCRPIEPYETHSLAVGSIQKTEPLKNLLVDG